MADDKASGQVTCRSAGCTAQVSHDPVLAHDVFALASHSWKQLACCTESSRISAAHYSNA